MEADHVAILLTGVGKRYDIVSAFAEHAYTIACDPSPLAPARYAAHVRAAPPRIDDPQYVPFLQEIVEEFDVRAVVPLTDLDIEVLARAPGLPAFVPAPDVCRATYDKYEAHELLLRHGLPSPHRPAGRGAAFVPGDGQATARLRRPLDPPGGRSRRDGVLRQVRTEGRAGDGAA